MNNMKTKKNRHKWSQVEITIYDTKQQTCLECGLVRYTALGRWWYSKEKLTESNRGMVNTVENEGCKNNFVNS